MTTCVTNYKIIQMARRGFLVNILAATLLGGLAITSPVHAQTQQASNLNISPKRVVFSGPNAASAVYIFNRGEQTVTCRVELIDGAMLPTGEIIALRIREFWVIPNAHMGYKKRQMSFFVSFCPPCVRNGSRP